MKFFLGIFVLVTFSILASYKINQPLQPVFGPVRMNYAPLILELGNKLATKHNIVFSGHGGKFMGGINTISFSFIDCNGNHLDISSARRMIIGLVDEMVAEINADTNLKPYLVTIPFTPKQIDIQLMFNETNNRWVFEPAIGAILFFEGDIIYKINSESREFTMKTIKEETYDEAVVILDEELGKANQTN